MKCIFLTAFYLLISLLSNSVAAAELNYESGEKQTQLVELYTSEGCSSCPPADRWLSSLKSNGELWSTIIPIAFHVDYWDYLGWKDIYAKRQYSQRQRLYAHQNNEPTVYTPGLRVNGEEWKAWRYEGASKFKDDKPSAGNLVLIISENGEFKAHYESQDLPESLVLNVAILGMGIRSNVSRGENRGRTLKQDFVALEYEQFNSAQINQWQGNLKSVANNHSGYAIVAWVQDADSLQPIQSVGGEIPKHLVEF